MVRDEIKNRTFERIGDRYNTLIDPNHFLGRNAFEDTWMTQPPINIGRNGTHYDIEIGLPGYNKKDINISVFDGVLEVKAKGPERETGKQIDEYIQKELDLTGYKKIFRLLPNVDRNKIRSVFSNGLLKIKLPLKKSQRKTQGKVKVW